MLQHLFHLIDTFRRVEDSGFIHIVPESFDALVCQEPVLTSEPCARLVIQQIREMRIPRPHSRYEVASVFTPAEVAVLDAFLVHIVAFLHLDARVDDGNQPDILIFHFLNKFRKVREIFFVQCKILEILHIVDIHVDHVQRNIIFPISLHYMAEIILRLITPSALAKTKSISRRDIASADDLPELLYDVIG